MGDHTWPTGIRPWGNGIQIRVYRHGQEFAETVEGDPYSARDLAAAVKRRDALKARLKLGLPIHADDKGARLTLFSEAAQGYLDSLDAAVSTHLSYEAVLNSYWMPAFGNWPVTEITPNAIKGVLAGRQVSVATRRRVVVPLKGALDYARVTPNPAVDVVKGRRQKAEIQRYTPQQRQNILDKLDGQPRVYFALLFGCGLRPGEALAVRWEDYDGETLHIHRTMARRLLKDSTKTYKRRRVHVPTWLRPILDNHTTRLAGEWIISKHTRRPAPYTSAEVLNKDWTRAHRLARLPWRVPYVCRHTRAAELLSQGVPPGEAAQQMGHSLQMFIATYAEWIEAFSKDRDMARFDGVQVDTSGWSPVKDRTEGSNAKPKVLKFKGNG